MINPQQIKKALVKLAEFKKRPHYEPATVRYIVENFDTHPLREAILYFCDTSEFELGMRYSDLLTVCCNKAMIQLVHRITGIDPQPILDGTQVLTNATWEHLKKHFDVLDDVSVGQVQLKEDFEHECGFDMWLQDAIKHSQFSWETMTYDDKELNEAWLSFQDFRSGG